MADQGLKIGQEENVLIRAGACQLTLLPALGGKIASLRLHDQELLQTPLLPLAPRNQSMAFHQGDASGWDECLPSVAQCSVQTAAGPALVPDHGDLWRVPWTRLPDAPDGAVRLRASCFSLPLELERSAALVQTATGWRLVLNYKVRNTGSFAVPWSWAAHPLFIAEQGDRILLPDSIPSLRLEGSGGARLGQSGDSVDWPVATLANGSRSDLSIAQSPDSHIGDKLFAGPLTAHQNWCALERPTAGVRIRVTFDPAATPYLGLWICYGGWPDGPGLKQKCVALEPATAPVDSLAQTGPWTRTLNPGDSFSWPMTVDIEPIEAGTRHA